MLAKIVAWIARQSIIWVTTTLLAILTLFSQTIVDRIKTGLNMANQRAQYFPKIAGDLSTLDFNAESVIKDYSESLEPGQGRKIGPKFLDGLVTQYNNSIDTVRKNEFLYRYWIRAYYGRRWILFRTNALAEYDAALASINKLDTAVHTMNRIAVKIKDFVAKDSTYTLSVGDSTFLDKDLRGVVKTYQDSKEKIAEFVNALE